MRIRKRQVPLSFSSLSDPLLPHSPPVQLPLSSDPPNNAFQDNNRKLQQYDSRQTIVIGAQTTNNGILPQSTSSTSLQVHDGRWCEREKAFPLKKRRSFERSGDDQDDDDEDDNDDEDDGVVTTVVKSLPDEKKMMKTKMNKLKCTLSVQKQSKVDVDGKKRSRGGSLMEGSRCSRVNGRGWRCCQQTLVGYSLCEHHLGKGRLRSMNNVRNRSLAAVAPKNIVDVDKDEKKPSPSPSPFPPPPSPSFTLASKKRMKLGVVKARSMSSLLGQPDIMVVTPPPPPPPPTLHDDDIDK